MYYGVIQKKLALQTKDRKERGARLQRTFSAGRHRAERRAQSKKGH